jgi:glycosyltransferase involved in cell wall biosynthesis
MVIFGSRGHYSAIGGVENSLRALVGSASASQRESIIICRHALSNESISGAGFALPNGVNEINYRDDTCFSIWRRLFNLFRGGVELPSIYKRLFNEHPNAVVIVRHHSHVLAAKFVGFQNVRYLVPSWSENQLSAEIDGADWTTKMRLLVHKKIDGYLQRKAVMKSEVFVFSRSMRRQVINAFPSQSPQKHIRVVRPGIDASRFYPGTQAETVQTRARLGLPSSAVIWLFVGRFVHAKGLNYVIDALELSSDENILMMVGEGDLKGSLIQNIVQRGLQQRVRFFEKALNVEDFYRVSDVFVMSSSYEPFGQTIIEASACGLPIAAFSEASGAITATHELGLDFAISYAERLTGASLKAAIGRALALSNDKANVGNGEKTHDLFSWETLLADLLAY